MSRDNEDALYQSELDDLKQISDRLTEFMHGWKLNTLYVNDIELDLWHDGGNRTVFKLWWDYESEGVRIEKVDKP